MTDLEVWFWRIMEEVWAGKAVECSKLMSCWVNLEDHVESGIDNGSLAGGVSEGSFEESLKTINIKTIQYFELKSVVLVRWG